MSGSSRTSWRRLAVLYSEDVIGENAIEPNSPSQRPGTGESPDPADESLSGAVARHVDRISPATTTTSRRQASMPASSASSSGR
jgi:hypothetical protein